MLLELAALEAHQLRRDPVPPSEDVGYFNGIPKIRQFEVNIDAITSQTGEFTAKVELK